MGKTILSNISILIIPIYLISTLTVGKLSEICGYFGASREITSSLKLILSCPLTWLIAYCITKRDDCKFSYSFSFGEARNIPLIIIASIGIQYGIIAPIISLIPIYPTILNIVKQAFLIIPVSSIIFSVVILSPVFEELLYRGIILDKLLKNKSRWTAIFIGAFILAFIHFNPYQFCSVFLLSIYIGWIYSYTKSVSVCMLIHFVTNSTELGIAYIKNPDNLAHDLMITSMDWSSRITIFFTAISLVIALFSLYELQGYFRNKELKNKVT